MSPFPRHTRCTINPNVIKTTPRAITRINQFASRNDYSVLLAVHGIIVRLVRCHKRAAQPSVLLQHPLDIAYERVHRRDTSKPRGHIGARVRTRDTRMQERLSDARKPGLYCVLRAVFKPEFIPCQDSFIPGVVAERNDCDSSLLCRW